MWGQGGGAQKHANHHQTRAKRDRSKVTTARGRKEGSLKIEKTYRKPCCFHFSRS
jgi:hypothetical protein